MATDSTNNPPPRSSSKASQEPSSNERKIAELIARLLSHYWTADDDPAIRSLQAADWIEDLEEFPLDIVQEVCRQWRRTQTRRPTPADLVKLAWTAVASAEWQSRAQITRQDETEDSIRERCRHLYGPSNCVERHSKLGIVCFASCKLVVEGERILKELDLWQDET